MSQYTYKKFDLLSPSKKNDRHRQWCESALYSSASGQQQWTQ